MKAFKLALWTIVWFLNGFPSRTVEVDRVVSVQVRPDLSGTWTFDVARSSRTTPVLGDEAVLRQDAGALTIWKTVTPTSGPTMMINGARRDQHEPIKPVTHKLEYAFDGSESRSVVPQPALSASGSESAATVAWTETKLVMKIHPTGRPAPAIERVFHLEPDGTLVVDVTQPVPNGGGDEKTTHVYKKKSESTTAAAVTPGGNLAGTWRLDRERTMRPQIMNPLLGEECVITQDQRVLTLRGTINQMTPASQRPDITVDPFPAGTPAVFDLRYALDGTPARQKMPARIFGAADVETVGVVNWNQATMIVTTFWSSGTNNNSQRVFHIEPDGTLVIDALSVAAGPAPLKAKYVYIRR